MRGRPPKPPILKLVTGTARSRGKAAAPGKQSAALAVPPAYLTAAQGALWSYCLRHAAPGQIPATGLSLLAIYVVASDLHRQALALIGDELVVETVSGHFKPHPAMAVLNTQAGIMLRAGAELGFSTAARGRMTLAPDPGPQDEFFPDAS